MFFVFRLLSFLPASLGLSSRSFHSIAFILCFCDMRLDIKKLKGLPVQTAGGMEIGSVLSAEVDADTGRIETFFVRKSGTVGMFGGPLAIAWAQVIRLSEDALVVDDAVVKIAERETSSIRSVPTPAGAALESAE